MHECSGLVKFRNLFKPNVQNGSSWSVTTLSKKLNLVNWKIFSIQMSETGVAGLPQLKIFFTPIAQNGSSWSATTLDFFSSPKLKTGVAGLWWLGQIKKAELSRSREKTLPLKEQQQLHSPIRRTTCLADKTNHPVKGLSLNRSQYGSCSTKYDTPAGT